jgi:hypothetical protein
MSEFNESLPTRDFEGLWANHLMVLSSGLIDNLPRFECNVGDLVAIKQYPVVFEVKDVSDEDVVVGYENDNENVLLKVLPDDIIDPVAYSNASFEVSGSSDRVLEIDGGNLTILRVDDIQEALEN